MGAVQLLKRQSSEIAELRAEIERLKAALQAVMDEYRDGYGLRCVEQVRDALARKEE